MRLLSVPPGRYIVATGQQYGVEQIVDAIKCLLIESNGNEQRRSSGGRNCVHVLLIDGRASERLREQLAGQSDDGFGHI
jgi:hypothetical protein